MTHRSEAVRLTSGLCKVKSDRGGYARRNEILNTSIAGIPPGV